MVYYPVLYVNKESFEDNEDFELFFTVLKALFVRESICSFAEEDLGFQKKDYLELFFEHKNCNKFAFVCLNAKRLTDRADCLNTEDTHCAVVHCYASEDNDDESNGADYSCVAIFRHIIGDSTLVDTFDYTKRFYYQNPENKSTNSSGSSDEETVPEKKKRGRPKKQQEA